MQPHDTGIDCTKILLESLIEGNILAPYPLLQPMLQAP